MKFYLFILATLLSISACSQSENTADNQIETPLEAAVTSVQEIVSKDGSLTLKTTLSFADQSNNASLLPENVSAEQLQFLQFNEDNAITLYAISLGAISDQAAYIANVKKQLEADNSLYHLQIDEQNNRLNYQYNAPAETDNEAESIMQNESCAIVFGAQNAYSVCAASPEMDAQMLADVVRDIALKP